MQYKKLKQLLAVCMTALLLTGCGSAGSSSSADTGNNTTASDTVVTSLSTTASTWSGGSASEDSGYADTYDDSAVKLTLSGDSVTSSLPDGVTLEDGVLTISKAGDYVLSGTFTGQILIDASSDDTIHLYLENVTITNETSSAIFGSQSDLIVITLVEGSTNTLTDGTEYVYADATETEPNATIFSKDDLIFNGDGTLIVNANYADAIRSKDDLILYSGTYEITSASDGLQGKDSVEIYSGSFTINAQKDAVKASNDTESDKGYVTIYGGSFLISAGDDAFHAETAMVIHDGEIVITTCYEGIEGLTVTINGGNIDLYATDDGINAAGGSDSNESFFGGGMMGGNSDAVITINGGNIHVTADGDGIDSNGTFVMNGGTLYVDGPSDSANGALDYELSATVNGGTVVAVGSSGMALGFSTDSTQPSILYNLGSQVAAGSTISLTDSDGNELINFTTGKSCNSVVLSCPELTVGETYTLTCGTESVSIEMTSTTYSNGQGSFGGGGMGGGNMGGGGRGGMGGMGNTGGGEMPTDGEMPEMPTDGEMPEMPGGGEMPERGEMPQ